MKNIFGENGLVYRVVTRTVDLLLLNIVFLVTCIPIITIGSACMSLYAVTLKMSKNEEGYIVRDYFCYFRSGYRKPMAAFLVIIFVYGVLSVDAIFLGKLAPNIEKWMSILILAVFLLVSMVVSYVFPLMARFENTVCNTFKNALIISMTRIIFTLPIVVVNLIPFGLLLYGGYPFVYGMTIYGMVGFALTAYLNSFLLWKVFMRYVENEQK